jgi:thiol-disulfide isomerase/thioredoxin
MNKIIITLFSLVLFFSCKKELNDNFILKGKVDSSFNGKFVNVLAKNIENGETIYKDSVEIINGTFEIKGTQKDPIFAMIIIKDSKGNFDQTIQFSQFIIEPGLINLFTEKKDSMFSFKVSGSPTNDDMNAFVKSIEPKTKALQSLYEKMNTDENKDLFESQIKKLDYELKETADIYIKNNPKKSWSLLMISGKFNYRDSIEDIESLYHSLDNELRKTSLGKQVENVIIKRKKLANGQKAPDFNSKSNDGKDFNLMSSLGKKVTILDFWASWCGPCRNENPKLVKIYDKYKSQGLEIISYSIDDKETAWKTAIEKDQMTWKHASNLIGWKDEIALNYQIESIPTLFILDSQGVIVGKNFYGNDLEEKIIILLNNQ